MRNSFEFSNERETARMKERRRGGDDVQMTLLHSPVESFAMKT